MCCGGGREREERSGLKESVVYMRAHKFFAGEKCNSLMCQCGKGITDRRRRRRRTSSGVGCGRERAGDGNGGGTKLFGMSGGVASPGGSGCPAAARRRRRRRAERHFLLVPTRHGHRVFHKSSKSTRSRPDTTTTVVLHCSCIRVVRERVCIRVFDVRPSGVVLWKGSVEG